MNGNSADYWTDKNGQRMGAFEHTAKIFDLEQIEPLAESTTRLIRQVGFKFERKFELRKQIILPNGDRDIYLKKIYPNRKSNWRLKKDIIKLKPRRSSSKGFPKRLQYLASTAHRCYGVGGNQLPLRKKTDLKTFLDNLRERDRKELIEMYKTIAKRKDHQWYADWAQEWEDRNPEADAHPDWSNRACWLFMFLDRLREGGLMDSVRGLKNTSIYPERAR